MGRFFMLIYLKTQAKNTTDRKLNQDIVTSAITMNMGKFWKVNIPGASLNISVILSYSLSSFNFGLRGMRGSSSSMRIW